MLSNINVLYHLVAAAVLLASGSGVCGQSRSASAGPMDNSQDAVADLDPFAAAAAAANGFYASPVGPSPINSAAAAAAAAAMDAVDLLDMEQRPILPPLTRSQLQRLLRNALFLNQPGGAGGLDALPFTGNVNTLNANSMALPVLPVPLPYGARMLRMRVPQMPEMKRTARGRSMQCYFNPISCY